MKTIISLVILSVLAFEALAGTNNLESCNKTKESLNAIYSSDLNAILENVSLPNDYEEVSQNLNILGLKVPYLEEWGNTSIEAKSLESKGLITFSNGIRVSIFRNESKYFKLVDTLPTISATQKYEDIFSIFNSYNFSNSSELTDEKLTKTKLAVMSGLVDLNFECSNINSSSIAKNVLLLIDKSVPPIEERFAYFITKNGRGTVIGYEDHDIVRRVWSIQIENDTYEYLVFYSVSMTTQTLSRTDMKYMISTIE